MTERTTAHREVIIDNVLRVHRARLGPLERGRVHLVEGPNNAGKTTVAKVSGALLSAEGNPLGLSRAECQGGEYLHAGAQGGSATLVDDDGELLALWDPTCPETRPAGPKWDEEATSPFAAGLVRLDTAATPKERLTRIETLLLPSPESLATEIEGRLRDRAMGEALAGQVREALIEDGFEAVERDFARRAREAKASWREATGEHWGAAKARDWRPPGWSPEDDQVGLTEAREALEAAVREEGAANAVQVRSEEQIAEARQAKAEVPDAERHEEQCHKEARSAEQRATKARNAYEETVRKGIEASRALEAMRTRKSDRDLTCPACGVRLALRNAVLAKAERNPQSDEEHRRALAHECERLEALRSAAREAKAERERTAEHARQVHATWSEARARTAVLKAKASDAEAKAGDPQAGAKAAEHARERTGEARERLRRLERRSLARERQRAVAHALAVLEEVGPKGVRRRTLTDRLERWNRLLAEDQVRIDPADGSVQIEGRPLPLAGRARRWRARVALVLAYARLVPIPWLILDDADVLDEAGWEAFTQRLDEGLKHARTPCGALVFATCRGEDHPRPTPAAWRRWQIREGTLPAPAASP